MCCIAVVVIVAVDEPPQCDSDGQQYYAVPMGIEQEGRRGSHNSVSDRVMDGHYAMPRKLWARDEREQNKTENTLDDRQHCSEIHELSVQAMAV